MGAAEARVIREVLSEHEQTLLRRSAQGKSPQALAQLYRGVYEGENGVEEALARIREKIESAMGSGERPLASSIADVVGEDDNGGVPVRSAPRGSLNGAGAASAPRAAAPPVAQRQPVVPSPERLPAIVHSPASVMRPSNVQIAREREEKLRELLADGREVTFREVAIALGIGDRKTAGQLVRRVCVNTGNRYVDSDGEHRAAWASTWCLRGAEPAKPPAPFAGGAELERVEPALPETSPAGATDRGTMVLPDAVDPALMMRLDDGLFDMRMAYVELLMKLAEQKPTDARLDRVERALWGRTLTETVA
jgi:DNA-binding CsgD family transcriptional regulator